MDDRPVVAVRGLPVCARNGSWPVNGLLTGNDELSGWQALGEVNEQLLRGSMAQFGWWCCLLVLLNAVFLSVAAIRRAERFARGHIQGISLEDMQFFRRGLRSGAFVQNLHWAATAEKRKAFLRRWLVVFPCAFLGSFASARLWLVCLPQLILLGVFWFSWQ